MGPEDRVYPVQTALIDYTLGTSGGFLICLEQKSDRTLNIGFIFI